MSEWGRKTFGQPCRECGYDWSIGQDEAIALVEQGSRSFSDLLVGSDGSQGHPELSWSAKAYVCHVGDNLRIWAERLAGAALGSPSSVAPYDQDLLAQARNYDGVPLEGALWSLGRAVRDWRDAVQLAAAAKVVLAHPERGDQSVADVCRTNAHDVKHHQWDLQRSLKR